MKRQHSAGSIRMCRREFLCTCGCTAAGIALGRHGPCGAVFGAQPTSLPVGPAVVRGAFLYPSTESLKKAGYYSWPGSGFDAEGRQKEYAARIAAISKALGMRIPMEAQPLHEAAGVTRFINEVKASKPDGLLLIPFHKSDWSTVCRIVNEAALPTVVLVTAGVVLNPHITQLHRTPGVYLISSLDNFDAVEYGMRMIRTARRMKQSCLLSIAGSGRSETVVEHLGTRVRRLPLARFGEEFHRTEPTPEVKDLAAAFRKGAAKIVEPTESDILDAARASVALKRLVVAEKADAVMMDCLGGIQKRLFPPPCMGYMTLRDEGIPAGCQNDLDPTLTMMLVQHLFDKPGFQQNSSCDTERNLYVGAHCTCPAKLNGSNGPAAPYALRSHAEAGVGTVPEVIWPVGMEVTMAHYCSGPKPQMIVYSGKVVGRHEMPPAGGCRTNVAITINEIADVADTKGMHQTIFAGNHAKPLRAFCQLYGIGVIT